MNKAEIDIPRFLVTLFYEIFQQFQQALVARFVSLNHLTYFFIDDDDVIVFIENL